MYFRFVRWLHQFEEYPRFNRLGAGLYVLLWTRMCGHDWRFAWQVASIYWFNRQPSSFR